MMLSLIILAIILIFPVGSNRLCQRLIPSKNIMKLNIISPYYAPFFKQVVFNFDHNIRFSVPLAHI